MKARNFLLVVTFLLAAASLGFALPPKAKSKVSNSTSAQTSVPTALPPKAKSKVLPATNSTSNPSAQTSAPTSQAEAFLDAAAGAGPPVSKECAAALLAIATSPEFLKCMPISALLPLLPVVSDPSLEKEFLADPAKTYTDVIEKPFIAFSTGICAAPKCSDEGVATTIKSLQDGCKAELGNNPLIKLAFAGTVFYSPLRDSVCFKDGDKFCLDETLLKVVSLPKSPFKISGNPLLDSVAVADPQDVCTKCNKNIINTVFNFINSKNNQLVLQVLASLGFDQKKIDGLKVAVAVKCGAKFEDGKIGK